SQQLNGIMGQLNQKFAAITDAKIVVVPPPAIPGLGSTGGFSFMLENRGGNTDIKEFEGVLGRFLAAANQRPEIAMAFSFFTAKTPGY
ncbi:hypothetical protein, partial [Rahnella sp. PAMC25617]